MNNPKFSPIIIGNWKMNHGLKETKDFLDSFFKKVPQQALVVICPPFTNLGLASSYFKDQKNIFLGAQNCHFANNGAFTGEISPLFLKELGCRYVLVGHSERRHIFGEDNDLLAKKLDAAIQVGLIPVFCVGEKLDERQKNQTFSVIENQLDAGLRLIKDFLAIDMVVAYEPVWAIGTGQNATPQQAQEVHVFIKKWLQKKSAKPIPVLYGGSVNPQNSHELLEQNDIDGLLIGGASLKIDSFRQILDNL